MTATQNVSPLPVRLANVLAGDPITGRVIKSLTRGLNAPILYLRVKQPPGEMTMTNPTHAHFSITRLGGVNLKMPVIYKGKSVIVEDPQEAGRMYRINAAKFIAGDTQFRDSSWAICKWDDRSERTAEAEANWQT